MMLSLCSALLLAPLGQTAPPSPATAPEPAAPATEGPAAAAPAGTPASEDPAAVPAGEESAAEVPPPEATGGPIPVEGAPTGARPAAVSPFAPRQSDTTRRGLESPRRAPTAPMDAAGSPWLGQRRPGVLEARRPLGAFALGGIVGFGVGYYYAGEATPGVIFSLVDGALVLSFVAVTVALNDLVIAHDFRSGESLARGERDFGRREARLYAASIALALTEAASHVVQAFGGIRAAERTNLALRSFSFVPLGEGGAASWNLRW